MPFSVREWPKWNLLLGGYPEAVARPKAAPLWFSSYIQTYLERDVRALTSIRDLPASADSCRCWRRAARANAEQDGLAGPLGVSVPTIAQWLHILEATFQIVLVPPFYESFSKRIVKSPKLYWTDPGSTLLAGDRVGPNVGEIAVPRRPLRGLCRLRDTQGATELRATERIVLVPRPHRPGGRFRAALRGRPGLVLVEAKASRTVRPAWPGRSSG